MIQLIDVQRTSAPKQKPAAADLVFGNVFTDHMVVVYYEPAVGWSTPRIQPYGPLALDPATMALHYGQSVFEGIKAFRSVDGAVVHHECVAPQRVWQLRQRRQAQQSHAGGGPFVQVTAWSPPA